MSESETCVAGWCREDDWCAITCTAEVLSKKWHPVLIHRLLVEEALGFNALKEQVEGISSTVLSSSLDDLEENGIVDRSIVNEKPVRVEYTLTSQGESLEPVIEEMANWGEEYLAASA